jgi:translation elongation factor EF-Tu-like GTPase
MTKRLYPFDDFEAEIVIRRESEGGRNSPTYNGIRWDFCYAGDNPQDGIYMIWPDFCDAEGVSFPSGRSLDIGVPLRARMVIANDELRRSIHRDRIAPGVRFHCQEGGRSVADGVVLGITGLDQPRPISSQP